MKQFVIGDFLKRIKKPIEIEDGVIYKRVTISGNHKGVSLRDSVNGSTIGTKKQFTVIGGDFIMSKIDARNGAFGIIPLELDGAIITGNFWTYKVDTDLVDTEWFFYFTHSYNFIQICIESSTGSTHRKYIDEKVFLNHKINLPSKSQQLEMVEQFKKSSKISNKLNSEIQTQKQLLTNLKQAILQEAIQGKLTEDWRSLYPELVSGSHSAESLLQSIKTEKAQLIKEGKIKKENPLPKIAQEEIPFELPNGWVWCKIDSLVYSIKDDIRTGPFGTALQKSEHKESGVPVLGIESIGKQGVFTGINKIFVSDKKAQALKSFEVKGLDIIVSRSGTIGELCLLPESIGKALISTNLMKISLNHKVINPLFFCHLFEGSTTIIDQMKELCKGSTRLFITQKILNNLFFQIPTLEEQKAIVEKVAALMQKCTALEAEITQSETNAQMLMQAVLKEAFEG